MPKNLARVILQYYIIFSNSHPSVKMQPLERLFLSITLQIAQNEVIL